MRDARLAWLCALAAIAPDLDFLPGLLVGRPALYHQGASHSLTGAAVFTLLLAGAYAGFLGKPLARAGLAKAWLPLLLAYASHLLLDVFEPDGRPPYGIPLFWPLVNATYIAPFHIFPGVHHAGTTDASVHAWISGILRGRNLIALGTELLVLGPPLIVAELWIRGRRRRERGNGAGVSHGHGPGPAS